MTKPTNLDELLAVLRDGDHDLQLDDLPTYGGLEPVDTARVWSWDLLRQIVGTCADDYAIEIRSDVRDNVEAHGEAAGAADYTDRARDVRFGNDDPSWAWPPVGADDAWLQSVGYREILVEAGLDIEELDDDEQDLAWIELRDTWCEAFSRGYRVAHDDEGGHLDLGWIAACRANEGADETLEAWICRARNCTAASVGRLGEVWIDGQAGGHWCTQDECNRLQATIDAGV